MKKILLSLIIFITLPVAQALVINEIMYNPSGSDNNKEFIEIKGTDNLTGFYVADSSSKDFLELLKFVKGNFSLIVEEGFDYDDINASIYSVGATIGNGLNNDKDSIYLIKENQTIASINYTSDLANDNSRSLILVNNTWKESCETGGSPGKENCKEGYRKQNISQSNQEFSLKIILPEKVYLGLKYNSLFRIENKNYNGEETLVFVDYEIKQKNKTEKFSFNKTIKSYSYANTGNLKLEKEGNYSLCGFLKNISVCKNFTAIDPKKIDCDVNHNSFLEKEVYENQEKIKLHLNISNETFPFIIEYWIEDLFGNIIKKKVNTTNINSKSFTPKISEVDRVFLLKSNLIFTACNNKNNNLSSDNKFIITSKKEINQDSNITIEKVYLDKNNKISFGENLKVKLFIRKGQTKKTMVELQLRDEKTIISETSKFYLNKQNQDHHISVLLKIKDNCDDKFDEKKYSLAVTGLETKDEMEIDVKGDVSNCQEKEEQEKIEIPEILSFYTRSKKYSENINLYYNIKTNKKTTGLIKGLSFEKTITFTDSSKGSIIVKPQKGKNLFVLQIKDDKKIIDSSILEFYLDYKNVTENKIQVNQTKQDSDISKSKDYMTKTLQLLDYKQHFLTIILALLLISSIFFNK
jgi:hypothetical protein